MTQTGVIIILILLANGVECRIYCNSANDCLFCGCKDYYITSCNYIDYYTTDLGYIDQPANFIEGEVPNICIQADSGWPVQKIEICSRRECPANLYMDNCICVGCPVGSYCTNGTQNLCPAGTYNPNLNSSNASACLPCPIGTYNQNNGLSVCYDCPVSHYQNNNGRTSCFRCNAGTYTVATGSQKFSDCISCPAGFACPAVGPMYSCTSNVDFSLTGQSNCTPCASTCANGLMEATPCTPSTNRVCKIPVQLILPKSCEVGIDCVNHCPEYESAYSDYVYCLGVYTRGGYMFSGGIQYNRYESQFDNTSNICSLRNHYQYPIVGINCNGPCDRKGRVCYNHVNCVPCAPGIYIKSTNCVCTPCPANSYCDGVNATVCAPICAPGNYESIPCSPTSDRVCKACDLCNTSGQFRMNCGGSSAGICASCTNPI